jgi:hypothetical protein
MKQYDFKIGITSHTAWFNNYGEAKRFAEFIGAELEKSTIIFKLQKDNKFCMFELEVEDSESAKLIRNIKFTNVKIWEI